MLLQSYFGPPVYTRELGPVSAQVYHSEDTYRVYIVGETVASFLGNSTSLEDCKEEIKCLESLVESDVFQREIANHRSDERHRSGIGTIVGD